MVTYGPAARALALRPPLADGGHALVALDWTSSIWWCVRCCRAVPGWAIREGYVTTLIGRWCPALFAALDPGPVQGSLW